MKFAQEYRSMLQTEGFSAHWLECAVPYRQLKKCLKKVSEPYLVFGCQICDKTGIYAYFQSCIKVQIDAHGPGCIKAALQPNSLDDYQVFTAVREPLKVDIRIHYNSMKHFPYLKRK